MHVNYLRGLRGCVATYDFKRFCLLGLGLACWQIGLAEPANAQVKNFTGRVAISADGNFHDRDDIGASPLGLAILEHAGFKNRLVHYGYNSHIWQSDASQKRDMTASVLGAQNLFGYNRGFFFDVDANPNRAYDDLAEEINKSTGANPLYILVGGPYEHVCQAIKRSRQNARQHVTVINHGDSNPYHVHNGSCNAAETAKLGIRYVDIINQNGYGPDGSKVNKYGFSNPYILWTWLENHNNADLRWLHSRMKVAFPGKADVSDAGLVWYLVTGGPRSGGDQRGNPDDLRKFFGGSGGNNNNADTTDNKPQTGDRCSVTAGTKASAQQKFRQSCGGQWTDCDKRANGGFVCASYKMN